MTPLLNSIALKSSYNRIHPGEKIILTLLSVYSILLIQSRLLMILYFFGLLLFMIRGIRVPLIKICKLLALPLPFIAMSFITLLISIDYNEGIRLALAVENVPVAINLFLRNISSVMCLYILMSTTPLHHILYGLKSLHCPKVLSEMITIVYKYIFIFIDFGTHIYRSQNARLGYVNYKQGMKSFALMIGAIFNKSMQHGQALFRNLEARGYQGTLHSVATFGKVNYTRMVMLLGMNIVLIFISRKLGI